MDSASEYNRVCWHSRRGMLELDLVLEPFVQQRYLTLSDEQRADYRRLLECEDQDLFGYFLGSTRPADESLAGIVDIVLEFARNPG
jgi:antitoxin CptB